MLLFLYASPSIWKLHATLHRYFSQRFDASLVEEDAHPCYTATMQTSLAPIERWKRCIYLLELSLRDMSDRRFLMRESNESLYRLIHPTWKDCGRHKILHHLKRVMGNALFTFEELSTILAQIEACLNSRLLSPLSADPTDLQSFTPAHFLVRESMTSLPDINVTDIQINRLDRWQLVQRVIQDF